MKFTIDKNRFLKQLTIASVAIGQKSPSSSLLTFKIEMFDNNLLVTASNNEITITSSCPVKENDTTIIANYETGGTLISAKFLLEIIRNISSSFVTLEIIDNVIVRISDDKSDFKLNAMNIDEYPDLDLAKTGETITFNGEDLKKIINQTCFAASTKEVRPVLTALNAKANGETVEFTATDSYRLAKKKFVLTDGSEFTANIPVKTLNEVNKLIENQNCDVTIGLNKIVFTIGDTTIYSRLISGDFPKTNNIFPTNATHILQVNADDMIGAIQRVSLLAIERENIVKLTVNENECIISSKSEQIGSANEKIEDFKYSGDRFEISFNSLYAIDAIKASQSEEVILSFFTEMSAFVITSPTDDSLTQLITPVRPY